jgi:hypothetical protein
MADEYRMFIAGAEFGAGIVTGGKRAPQLKSIVVHLG